jgi:uncharacterized protein (TIGR00369 family)
MSDESKRDTVDLRDYLTVGLDGALGFQFVHVSAEEVILEYEIGEQHRQAFGIVHGGVHCTAVESACSTGAGVYAMSRGQSVVGVENHTSFIRAVRAGRVRVTARPLTRGRRSQLWEAIARDTDGRLISSGRVRLLCLEPGSELAGQTVADRRRP